MSTPSTPRRNSRRATATPRVKTVQPNLPRFKMQQIPLFKQATKNLKAYGATEKELHDIVKEIYS